MADFVHLHLHSEYSLLDGACRIEDIPKAAREAGHKAVAITDHGVMYGVVDFYKACVAEGIKPIIGCEVYVARRTRFDKTHEFDYEKNHLVLLIKNETGYRNLINMVSKSNTECFYSKPTVDLELLTNYHEGLIALSACLGGYIPQAILNNSYNEAESYAVKLNNIFGEGNFYLELQDHGIEEQARVNPVLASILKKTGIPLVATNDVHYIKRSDADKQAILMCIQTNNVITDGRPLGFETDEFYYKSTDEMEKLFGQYEGAIENTITISEMCNFDFVFKKVFLPVYKPEEGQIPKDFLRKMTMKGLDDRIKKGQIAYDDTRTADDYKHRIEFELMVITSMGYSEYFLIVWDFVNYAKSNNIPTGPGRGSGAGSLVAYLLNITDVDPIKYGLLFEAFLNPERISMPDFDIDFCYERRDEVIKYVIDKYGSDHVAQIITFGTLAARAAVRDVGRALGMSYADVDVVAKLIPQRLNITIKDALNEVQELKTLYSLENNEMNKKLIDTAMSLEGMPRHASTHAAGVVITDKPVHYYVPLAGSEGAVITQFDMDTVASLGLLKFDFLALRYLTIISDTEKLIKETDRDFEIDKIPLDDLKTYELISSGNTDGLFQLESGGMRQMLIGYGPRSIEDIMIAIALYRPGPMDSIPRFIENHRNPEKIQYKIPELKEILDETYGCIVYQEHVMQIFRTIAGYTYGRADVVRRAISRKTAGVIEKERDEFVKGVTKRAISKENAVELFEDMTGFANYGFKKAHAAGYAMISYKTAYLKCNYPQMYLASLLTSVLGNNTKSAQYIAECAKYDIKVLPPDINESGMNFNVSGNDIRFGLLAIKNVGHTFISAILAERAKKPFATFIDFIARMAGGELNKRQIESLISAGAFDSLGVYRSRLAESYVQIIEMQTNHHKKNIAGQIDLLNKNDNDDVIVDYNYPAIEEFTLKERLVKEKESTGMFFSGHLLDDYTQSIKSSDAVPINDVISSFEVEPEMRFYDEHSIVKVAGSITKRVNKTTKNGENMAFITIEDKFAEIEGVMFPKVLTDYLPHIVIDNAVFVTGEITVREEENPKLLVKKVEPIVIDKADKNKTVIESGVKKLYLKVDNMEDIRFQKVCNLIEIFNGSVPVIFYDNSNKKYIKANNLSVYYNDFICNELAEILGKENVILK